MANCFNCGGEGHYARDCPRKGTPKGQSRTPGAVPAPWCSYCDETTRLVDLGYAVQRCHVCHPLRFQSLAQSRKCPNCNATVHEWDHGPCGCHSQPGAPPPRPAVKGRPDSTRKTE